jgi:predicted amidohydrolase YtcJ
VQNGPDDTNLEIGDRMEICHNSHQCSGCADTAALWSAGISRSLFIGAATTAAIAVTGPTLAKSQDSSPATTVYVAKRIITMESDNAASAVAVTGTRITAVGTLDGVIGSLQPGSFKIDHRFADRVITPGFIEQHLHPLLGALSMSAVVISIEDWDVPGNVSKAALDNAAYVSRLKGAIAAMKTAPADEILFTWGYHQYFHGNVYRPELDVLSADRPIVIWHRSCHELILNTAALKKYGITEESLIGHGMASSQASFAKGHFYEKGLTLVLEPVGKDVATPARLQTGVERVKAFLRAKGVTTICEPGTQLSRRIQSFWEESLGGNDVGFRTYFIPDGRALYDMHKGDLSGLVAATETFATWGKGNVSWLPKQVKLFADGAIFSQLMQMQSPYLDGHHGEWIAEPSDYEKAFNTYWVAGYHVHTHVNGDGGLQVVTDTLARNLKATPRADHRFTVVHFACSTDEQVKQLADLGAIISANPYYASALADKYSEFGLGPERANSMVRLGSAVRNGISISLHSDMPMAPADPLFLMWCAVNRTTASGRTAGPDQRIIAEKGLRAVTIEAAYSIELEQEIGSIKVGKKADLTVLDRDPLAVPSEQLKDVRVLATVFQGQLFLLDDTPYGDAGNGAELKSVQPTVSRDALQSVVG